MRRPVLRAISTRSYASVAHEPLLRPLKKSLDLTQLSTDSYNEINRVYSVPFTGKDESLLQLLPASVLRSFNELNTSGLLLRKSTKDIWTNLLEHEGYSCLLDGPQGIGKSSTLLQLASSARSSEAPPFLVLYAPSMGRWTAGYYPYTLRKVDGVVFDQPELTAEILSTFKLVNQARMPEEISKFLNSVSNPIDGLSQLFTMLEDLSTHRVLMVLDQVNALYCPTQYRSQESLVLVPQNFSVLSAFRGAIQNPKFSVLAANCNVDSLISGPAWDETASQIMKNKIELQPFNTDEVHALLEHYRELGHSFKSGPKYTQLVQFVSGGIPKNMAKACNYEQIYTV